MSRPATSSTLAHVVSLLNDGKVHSGTEMAKILGISRAAVWKVLQRLQDYHVPLHTQHQGYQLGGPLILLDKAKIARLVHRQDIILEVVESLPSTSDYLKQKATSPLPHFCLAEHQSKGRGRLGRRWISPFGCNLYLSLSLTLVQNVNEIASLSLVVGLCVVNMLKNLNPAIQPFLKWPNDIILEGKKMGGILIDIVAEAYGVSRIVIGIGLNINMRDQSLETVDQPWISLEHIIGQPQDRNVLGADLIDRLLESLATFESDGFAPFQSEWLCYALLRDKEIKINNGGLIKTGIARGIDNHGYLRLENQLGAIELVSCGDTSLCR